MQVLMAKMRALVLILIIANVVTSLLLTTHPNSYVSIEIKSSIDDSILRSRTIYFPSVGSYKHICRHPIAFTYIPPRSDNYRIKLTSNIFTAKVKITEYNPYFSLINYNASNYVVTTKRPISSDNVVYMSAYQKYRFVLHEDTTNIVTIYNSGDSLEVNTLGLGINML